MAQEKLRAVSAGYLVKLHKAFSKFPREGRVTQEERGPRTAWGREVGYFVNGVMVL